MNHELILKRHNEIEFEPIKHTYLYKGNYLTSGTTFTSQFHKPFNREEILTKLYPNEQTRVLKRYEWSNSSIWGTYIHELLELHFNNIKVDCKEHQFLEGVNLVEQYLRKGFEMVGTEVRITDGTLIAGTIDLLLYNPNTDKYILLDYKTCDKLSKVTYRDERFYEPLQHIEYNKFTKYSLQLSLYGAILEEHYGVEIEEMSLLWIPIHSEGLIWRCDDYRKEMKELIKQ